jgi:hypothetical protein
MAVAWKMRFAISCANAVKDEKHQVSKIGSRIAARFAKSGLTADLPEFHDQVPQPVKFTK